MSGGSRAAAPGGGPAELEFTKMHGAGNDFVVLDDRTGTLAAAAGPDGIGALARRLSDRHFGIGADQVLVVRASRVADFRMDIYDADGSEVEMCGNGIRCVYKYLRDRGATAADAIEVETPGGVVRPRWAGEGRVTVEMGRPVLEPAKIPTTLGAGGGPVLEEPLEIDGETWRVSCVSLGNPHAVIAVADPDAAPVATLGPRIEHHPAFPNRVNVEFAAAVSRTRLRQRTWERGTGETLACGSGACAVAVVAMLRGLVERRVTVELRGGELEIAWERDDGPVRMTGPAAEVFRGRIPLA